MRGSCAKPISSRLLLYLGGVFVVCFFQQKTSEYCISQYSKYHSNEVTLKFCFPINVKVVLRMCNDMMAKNNVYLN